MLRRPNPCPSFQRRRERSADCGRCRENMLGVTEAWVYAQSRAGKIPPVKLGRYRRYRLEAIERWIEDNESSSPRRQEAAAAAANAPGQTPKEATSMQRRSLRVRQHLRRGGTYFGKWRVGDRQIKRKLGPVRKMGTRDGLTKAMAEARLRALMLEVTPPPGCAHDGRGSRAPLAHAPGGARSQARPPRSYRSNFENQIVKRNIGAQPVDRLTREEAERFVAACRRDGLSPKSTSHCLALLQSICEYAIKQGWASDPNPCKRVDRPKLPTHPRSTSSKNPRLKRCSPRCPTRLRPRTTRSMYLAAFMTGMRQGELLGAPLDGRGLDGAAHPGSAQPRARRVRDAQEQARSSRSVPLADRLAGELDGSTSGPSTTPTTTLCSPTRTPASR